MDEQQEQTNAIARFAEAVKSRRALLGSGLATVGLAAFRDDDQEAAAGKRRNRRRTATMVCSANTPRSRPRSTTSTI
jgi:hypothetical protein